MALTAFREHWLFKEFFREPVGGWVGWGVLAVAVLFIAYEAINGDYWLIPLVIVPLAEVLPRDGVETAGLLRLVGFLYLCLFGLSVFVDAVLL